MASTSYLTFIYGLYIATAIGLTVWLARTLSRNGKLFLRDVFPERHELADAVNQLLVVGFYMLNLGYAFLIFRSKDRPAEAIEAIEMLVSKLGLLLVSLGVLHFLNMAVFYQLRRVQQHRDEPTPIPPTTVLPPPAPRMV